MEKIGTPASVVFVISGLAQMVGCVVMLFCKHPVDQRMMSLIMFAAAAVNIHFMSIHVTPLTIIGYIIPLASSGTLHLMLVSMSDKQVRKAKAAARRKGEQKARTALSS